MLCTLIVPNKLLIVCCFTFQHLYRVLSCSPIVYLDNELEKWKTSCSSLDLCRVCLADQKLMFKIKASHATQLTSLVIWSVLGASLSLSLSHSGMTKHYSYNIYLNNKQLLLGTRNSLMLDRCCCCFSWRSDIDNLHRWLSITRSFCQK